MLATEILSRKEAIEKGAKFFFTGKICAKGHIAHRYIASGQCRECAKVWRALSVEDHRRQAREYQQRNREKVKLRKLIFARKIRALRPWETLLNEARWRAKQTSKDFTLTKEWAAITWTGRCAITDQPFDLTSEKRTGAPYSPSIDRIDNSRGYTSDNSRFILFALNIFKRQMTDQEMLTIATQLITSSWASEQLPL